MNMMSLEIFKRFLFFSALIFAVTGCGSGSSSSSATGSATGSIAAKLAWSDRAPYEAAKALYKTPDGVTGIRIFVYSDASMADLITFKNFTATPGENGSGTIDGIPAGIGRAVKVEGISSTGLLTYLGTATVNVTAGPTATPVEITMETLVTSASPQTAPSAAGFEVTLTTSVPATIYYTTNEPATIYYTTNGADPTTGSPSGTSPVKMWIEPPATLKYFAVVRGLYESIKAASYSAVTP